MISLNDDQWKRLTDGARAVDAVIAEVTQLPPAAPPMPSALAWMTEGEEVAWINSLGFVTSIDNLHASYASFVPKQSKTSTTSTMNDTETDDLRNYYRLWKRTNQPGFLQQATFERDWQVTYYSQPNSGLPSAANVSHFYLMGLVDWWLDHQDQATLDAIHRLVDWVVAKVTPKLVDTRSTARQLQCLAYYREKIGKRDVSQALSTLVGAVKTAPVNQGFVSMPKWYNASAISVDGQPAGTDLRVLFPSNASHKNPAGGPLLVDAAHYNVTGFPGATSNQDAILMHALGVAARVLGDPSLLVLRDGVAAAYTQIAGFPVFDKTGVSSNMVVPYNFDPSAPELAMFLHRNASSTPLYVTQIAPFCVDPFKRRTLSQQALLRQYSEYTKVDATTELGRAPRYFPWRTWENNYFLSQK